MPINRFGMHIRVESDIPAHVDNDRDIICLVYPASTRVASLRIATSLISPEQAAVSMKRELDAKKGFLFAVNEAKAVWNKLLKRADVVVAGELTGRISKYLTVFYSGLTRALLFPRRLDEIDEHGERIHYSPYDPSGGTHPGILVTDNGFWDTFRTVYPLLSLIYPDHLGDIVQGWLNAYKEGGWLPSWASPGYRNCMVGTFADVVVADAIVKNVKKIDLSLARDALMKDSFSAPPALSGGAAGKDGLDVYTRLGFIPDSSGESVSRTLDFGFADFSTAKAFRKLASLPEFAHSASDLLSKASILESRAVKGPESLFDSLTGFMVPRDDGRKKSMNFNPITWGNGFTEGSSWHHSFPPYALETLVRLHGGQQKLLAKLREMLVSASGFNPGSYGQQIHEMTEFRAGAMGQYGHNNQPCHHILYLFALLGDRSSTETNVRQVMDRAYGTDFFAGDEDNGEQGAWFVLSALGLFVVAPGTPDYVLGSPIFKHVMIDRGSGGEKLHIVALGTDESRVRVQNVYFSGSKVQGE